MSPLQRIEWVGYEKGNPAAMQGRSMEEGYWVGRRKWAGLVTLSV